jgi:large subunit ribosomal protein L6
MRLDHIEERLEVPAGIKFEVANGIMTVEGSKGKLTRPIDPKLSVKLEGTTAVISVKNASKREKTLIGTFKAHFANMLLGVNEAFVYRMKVCSGHFPMTVVVKGSELIVKNYLGEKVPRILKFKSGVDVKVEGDIVVVSSPSRELAGQTAASIEKLTCRADYDKRIFQDGIYITEKAGKEVKG